MPKFEGMSGPSNINLFLLLFGALQGLLLVILLLRRRRDTAGLLFSGFILLAAVQILHKVVSKVWLMEHLPGWYQLGYELPFLFGPVIFLYTRAVIRPIVKLSLNDLAHALPFFIFASSRLAMIYLAPDSSLLSLLLPTSSPGHILHAGLQLASLWIYGRLAWRMTESGKKHPVERWLRQFIGGVVVVETLLTMAIKLMVIYYGHLPEVRLAFLSLTLLLYWITYRFLDQPELLTAGGAAEDSGPKYANSGLRPEEARRIRRDLERLMAEEAPYTKAELTLDDLARRLDVPRHHLSQVLNTEIGAGYPDFINAYRLERARRLLLDPACSHYSIAAIAYEAGFRSISTFNAAFKKETGKTPSQFRKSQAAQ